MPHPKEGYKAKDGKKVPSVTTILSRFKESGGLVHWAWQLGKDGIDYRDMRDQAANAGTLAHDMVEQWIQGKDPAPDPVKASQIGEVQVAAAKTAFRAFLTWAEQSKLKVTHTELSLVSEKHRFAGCLDAMLVDGERSLGDWKTSNRIYGDYLMQLGAYGILWDENFPDMPITGGYHLIKFGKEFPDFTHHFWSDLEEAKHCFLLLREAYDLVKRIDKRAE